MNESIFIGTPFEPWGGLVNCSEDSAASLCSSANGKDIIFGACVKFTSNITKDGQIIVGESGAYCSCMLNYGKTGKDCMEATDNATVVAVSQVLIFFFCLFVFGRLGLTLVRAKRMKLLELNPAVVTIFTCMTCTVFCMGWCGPRALVEFNLLDTYKLSSISTGMTGGNANVAICTCMIVWQDVLQKTKSKLTSKARCGILWVKVAVGIWSTLTAIIISVLVLKGLPTLAAMIAMACFVIAFILYAIRGHQLKAELIRSSGGKDSADSKNTASPLRRVVDAIQSVIKKVMIFIIFFIIFALWYSSASKVSKSLSQDVSQTIGMCGMQVITMFCMKWIGDYAAAPLLKKISKHHRSKNSVAPGTGTSSAQSTEPSSN